MRCACSVIGRSFISHAASAAGTSTLRSRWTASDSAFIIAHPPPCPMFGGSACAASPMIATRPADQRLSLIRSKRS